jgi:hypothetical protein
MPASRQLTRGLRRHRYGGSHGVGNGSLAGRLPSGVVVEADMCWACIAGPLYGADPSVS